MLTSLCKTTLDSPVWLGPEDLEGNWQANRKHHGGPDKAICCYPSEHYPAASDFLRQRLAWGAFGENFTLAGLLENEVSVGDRFRVGDAVVEVTQPRHPCATLSKRYGSRDLPAWILRHGYTGWYLRTIEQGLVEPADELVLLERPYPRWTITELNRLMAGRDVTADELRQVIELPPLSADWRKVFQSRLKEA